MRSRWRQGPWPACLSRMRRGAVAFGFVLLATASGASSQAAPLPEGLRRLAFTPTVFHVGEEVEVIALIDTRRGEPFLLKAGDGLPEIGEGADPELHEARLVKTEQGWEYRVRFVPWTPGRSAIPPLVAKGGAPLPALPYTVASVLEPGDREPSPPKPQRDPPGTALYLYGFVGLVLALAAMAAAIVLYALPGARSLIAQAIAAQAFRTLSRSLAYLERSADNATATDFYAVLSRALRLYLAARSVPEAPALTPTELQGLPEARFPAPGLRDEAARLFAEADGVRFGGLASGPDTLRDAVRRARALAKRFEEAAGAHV